MQATRSHWSTTIIGRIIGNSIPQKYELNCELRLEVPSITIERSTVPEVILPKRRKASEITFAKSQRISRNARKNERVISASFTTGARIRYFHLGRLSQESVKYFFQVRGI